MTGTPEGSTESGFMEKPGIKPATPGLQDIGLSPAPQRLQAIESINAGTRAYNIYKNRFQIK